MGNRNVLSGFSSPTSRCRPVVKWWPAKLLTHGIYYTNTRPLSTIIWSEFATKLCFFRLIEKIVMVQMVRCFSVREPLVKLSRPAFKVPITANIQSKSTFFKGSHAAHDSRISGRSRAEMLVISCLIQTLALSFPPVHRDPNGRRRKKTLLIERYP